MEPLYEQRIRRGLHPLPIPQSWVFQTPTTVTSGLVYQGTFTLLELTAMNSSGSLAYLHLFDRSYAPTAGLVPALAIPIAAAGEYTFIPPGDGLVFRQGLAFGLSTQAAVFVPTSAVLWLAANGLTP